MARVYFNYVSDSLKNDRKETERVPGPDLERAGGPGYGTIPNMVLEEMI